MQDRQPGSPTREQDTLLPGWSSLVILLTIFGALALVTLLAIVSGDRSVTHPDDSGRVAYAPEDFPELDLDPPLLASVREAGAADRSGSFDVPPPPFSDEMIFPCSECHADLDPDTERRELGFHEEIELHHGSDERWCFDCHAVDNRDRLRLVSGSMVTFEESFQLCGQCHGTIYRDWRSGIHGQRRGYWSGAKSYLLCAHCHDPHAPRFPRIQPLPPPVRPEYLR